MTTGSSVNDEANSEQAKGPAAHLVQKYVQVQEGTTPPDQVMLRVFDGLVQLVEEAKVSIEKQDFEHKNRCLLRSQLILHGLSNSLQRSIGEKLYRDLCGLYLFVHRRLVEGNLRNDRALLDEALQVLRDLGETWRLAVGRYRSELSKATQEEKTDAEPPGFCVQC